MPDEVDDLLICGGGVIGLAIAWQAALRGLKVRLLEQRHLGRGASWAGAGILPPGAHRDVFDPLERMRAASHAMFPEWCQRLGEASGIDVEFERSGGLYLARSIAEWATLTAQEAWWDDHGIVYQRVSAARLGQLYPFLGTTTSATPFRGGWYLEDECQVRNPRYLQALIQACQRQSVGLHEHEAVVSIEPSSGGPIVVATKRATYRGHRLCLTTGAWTPLLSGALPLQTGIFPVRGQMVLFRYPSRPFSCVINEGHRYLVPRRDGHVLVGSCEEEVGYNEQTSEAMIEELRQWAYEVVPSTRQAHIERSWAGLRPGSIDGLPYLGSVPNCERIYVAAGHYRHGLHLSPITAMGMLALMLEEPFAIDLAPFRVTRGMAYRNHS